MPPSATRHDRFNKEPAPSAEEFRTPTERDRDRVIHTSAFRRLAAVTQVVPAVDDGYLLHNRLTHTIKVAQIARRLAQKVQRKQPKEVKAIGGVEADAVEAAALAHDLGHPPFGHIAEQELDRLACNEGLSDGFEGNAQSFRIVTKLALRAYDQPGLNLTRATLNAIIKYPWLRGSAGKKKHKWNAYATEKDEFEWARIPYGHDEEKSAEAELMDWADDIAYSVHDVEDFYRVGLIPLDRLLKEEKEVEHFLEGAFRRRDAAGLDADDNLALATAFRDARQWFPSMAFKPTDESRQGLRTITKTLIARYVGAIELNVPATKTGPRVTIQLTQKREVTMLKELTWFYVINNPSLATQQHGQRKIVGSMFQTFVDACTEPKKMNLDLFPLSQRGLLTRIDATTEPPGDKRLQKIRVVLDLIASMTEQHAVRMYRRLEGVDPGSALDAVYL
jgi:dGTPase